MTTSQQVGTRHCTCGDGYDPNCPELRHEMKYRAALVRAMDSLEMVKPVIDGEMTERFRAEVIGEIDATIQQVQLALGIEEPSFVGGGT